jgi:hypothetical protein
VGYVSCVHVCWAAAPAACCLLAVQYFEFYLDVKLKCVECRACRVPGWSADWYRLCCCCYLQFVINLPQT